MDKTPKFTAKINEILKDLKPHTVMCPMCNKEFFIDENDIEFFKKNQVPSSRVCSDCNRQKRFAFANYTSLFKRKCNVLNHSENIISSIPEGTEFPVYDFDYYWHGDRNWAMNGFNFDLNNSFFEQFKKLFFISPQPALNHDPASINSEYSAYGVQMNKCYYIFGGIKSENIMFSLWPMLTKNSLDLLISRNTDLSYECVFPENCYNCNFLYFSNDCFDCNFVYDCRNCNDCFGCVNLRNQKYCIWNEQYTKDDYLKKIKEYNLGDSKNIKECKRVFEGLMKSLPIRATRNEHSDNFYGNYIVNSKNSYNSFWVFNSENIKYTDFTMESKDVYGCSVGSTLELCYSTSCVGNHCFNIKFSYFGREISDCEYSINLKNCKYCFGCIGLTNSKFCIFNKQYTEEEYWELLDNIKTKMLEDGEYGEFFPLVLSPFPYNASLSNIIYPVSKEKVLELGGWWHDEEVGIPEGMKLIKVNEIESDIKNITDEILNVGIISENNGKPFRIIKEELDFYRRKNIAIPSLTPYERIVERFKYPNNFKVFKDKCFKCGVEILSSYATSEGYKPYCDDCYKKEIY